MTRSLHLIDIENLAAGGAYDAHDQLVRHLDATWAPGDIVTIASNARIWRQLAWEVPVAHRFMVTSSGPDSADMALLTSADEFDLSTFNQLVIGSGDHIFTDLALNATDCGTRVVVVANRGALAYSLKLSSDQIHLLPLPDEEVKLAA